MFEWFVEVTARWVSAGAAVISVACAILVMRRSDAEKSAGAINKLGDRVTEIERDCSNIKIRLDQVPTKADLEGLKSDVRALGRDVGKVEAGIDRIEEFLRERGK